MHLVVHYAASNPDLVDLAGLTSSSRVLIKTIRVSTRALVKDPLQRFDSRSGQKSARFVPAQPPLRAKSTTTRKCLHLTMCISHRTVYVADGEVWGVEFSRQVSSSGHPLRDGRDDWICHMPSHTPQHTLQHIFKWFLAAHLESRSLLSFKGRGLLYGPVDWVFASLSGFVQYSAYTLSNSPMGSSVSSIWIIEFFKNGSWIIEFFWEWIIFFFS